jgi:hypothetical protein
MPDFEANEDVTRLPGTGPEGSIEPADVRPPAIRRVRRLAGERRFARRSKRGRVIELTALKRRRPTSALRCARPRLCAVGAPPRRRRNLWTLRHGRPPGSPS